MRTTYTQRKKKYSRKKRGKYVSKVHILALSHNRICYRGLWAHIGRQHVNVLTPSYNRVFRSRITWNNRTLIKNTRVFFRMMYLA